MRVFLHARERGTTKWAPNGTMDLDFQRLPEEGEHFILEPGGPLYEVQLVVHTPNQPDGGEFDAVAEVYAVSASEDEVLGRALADCPGCSP